MSKVTCFNVPENPYGQLLSMVFPLGVRIQVIFLNNSSLQKSSSELPAGTTMEENWKCSALARLVNSLCALLFWYITVMVASFVFLSSFVSGQFYI